MAGKFLDWIQTMVVDYHLTFIFDSHTRKSGVGVNIKNNLDDLYGSRHWSITPDSLYIMYPILKHGKLLIAKDRSGDLEEDINYHKEYESSTFWLQSEQQKQEEENADAQVAVEGGTGVVDV
jgi:hypothetical protein